MIQIDRKNLDSQAPEDKDKDLFVTCFTDASYCPDTGAWGTCFWIKAGMTEQAKIITEGGVSNNSNSTLIELKALNSAKNFICGEYDINGKVIVIQSDCQSALENFCIKDFKSGGAKFVKKKHVKAHTSNKTKRTSVNKLVDRKARAEMKRHR